MPKIVWRVVDDYDVGMTILTQHYSGMLELARIRLRNPGLYCTDRLSVLFFLVALLSIAACKPKENREAEIQKIEKVLWQYYDALARFDYERMSQACASDFTLFEVGHVWDLEDQINFLKSVQGKTKFAYSFKDVYHDVDLKRLLAIVGYRKVADSTLDGKLGRVSWLESAALRREDGKWKIYRINSSPPIGERRRQ